MVPSKRARFSLARAIPGVHTALGSCYSVNSTSALLQSIPGPLWAYAEEAIPVLISDNAFEAITKRLSDKADDAKTKAHSDKAEDAETKVLSKEADEPHGKEMKILGTETEESRRSRNAYKTCETEAPRKAGFKKHRRRVHEEYGFACNQRGNKVTSEDGLKIRTLGHENYGIDCNQCDEEFMLKDDPKEVWNPGIAIAKDNLVLL